MAALDQEYADAICDRGLSEPERRADLSDGMLRVHHSLVDKQAIQEMLEPVAPRRAPLTLVAAVTEADDA